MILDRDRLAGPRGWSSASGGGDSWVIVGDGSATGGPYKPLADAARWVQCTAWLNANSVNWVMLRAPTLNASGSIYNIEGRPGIGLRGDGSVFTFDLAASGATVYAQGYPAVSADTAVTLGLWWDDGGWEAWVNHRLVGVYPIAWTPPYSGLVRVTAIQITAYVTDYVESTTRPPFHSGRR